MASASATAPRRTEELSSPPGSAPLEPVLVAAATCAMGLITGFFYAYACSVMVGLHRTDDRTFLITMQWINATVRNAGFAPSFFGALVLSAAAAGVSHRRRSPSRWLLLIAAGLYAVAFLVTMGVSVPLNEELAQAGNPDRIADLAAVRRRYERPWVFWNLVRTILSTGAFLTLVVAAIRIGPPARHARLGGRRSAAATAALRRPARCEPVEYPGKRGHQGAEEAL